MDTIRERAEYLVRLMPSLSKGIAERIPLHGHTIDHRLTVGQMHTLGFLHHHGPETMGAMARRARVALSTMTENVNRLVRLGLVARIPDERDRRVVRIQLTAKGRTMFERQLGQHQDLFARLLRTLPEKDQKRLVGAFRTIEKILLTPRTTGA